MAPLMYTISTMHCMTVSLAYGGEGLGTAWGEQLAIEKLTKAGFVDKRSPETSTTGATTTSSAANLDPPRPADQSDTR